MAACNAHYYAARDPLGAAGDFVTAPEISQMFGELVGAWAGDLWDRAGRPDAAYVEFGPGRGTLAADALRAMRGSGFTPQVHFVETSPALRKAQAERVPAATWHATVGTLPTDRALLVVANEFFDALPVRQLVRNAGTWRERMVGWDGGRFVVLPDHSPPEHEGKSRAFNNPVRAELVEALPSFRAASKEEGGSSTSSGRTADRFRMVPRPDEKEGLEDGAIVERRRAASAIAATLAARIARQGGALLVIDYGHRRPAFGDTLQAVRRHVRADPFEAPGETDLTAHVDFAALAAAAAPLAASRIVDQGEWLLALGLTQRAAALARAAPARVDEIAAAYRRLSDPGEMGALFKVLALTAPGWPVPAGF